MPANRVWVAQDADVLVYRADKNGNRLNAAGNTWTPVDGPLFSYCYFQSTTLTNTLPNSRRPVTGRPRPRIVTQAFESSLDVNHFYLTKAVELDINRVFAREQFLELVLMLTAYDNPTVQEPHTLKIVKAIEFSITVSDNQNVQGAAKFIAEQFS